MPIVNGKLLVETPPVFDPLCVKPKKRYRGARGGRGSGKSHFFAEDLILDMMVQHTRACCAREVQLSIKDSSKQLLEDKIDLFEMTPFFKITDREIVYEPTDSLVIFRGMQNHTAQTIKSLEAFNRFYCDEAQQLTERSIQLITPTFRAKGSVLDFAWNPISAKTPVERMFNENADSPDFALVTANYYDNPFFPEDIRKDMERDRARDIDKYSHVWLGHYLTMSEARVFRNWSIKEFNTPADARFYHGVDFGYALDPTVMIRCFIQGRTLYIDYEASKVHCEIDDTPNLFRKIPDSDKWPCTADNARPETIAYLRRHGYPRMKESIKGKGSVEDGIEFLKSFDIVVHPRCTRTIEEMTTYSWKIDPRTEEILPILADKDNHVIDALRYALEGTRRSNYSLAGV
jgi:phage terminase large subunit